jgi:hypothetical protein
MSCGEQPKMIRTPDVSMAEEADVVDPYGNGL